MKIIKKVTMAVLVASFALVGGANVALAQYGGSYTIRAIPAIPAVPTISPAIPATPAVPAVRSGRVLGASDFSYTRGLKLGFRNNDVKELQQRLALEGVYTGPITGYFGPLTRAGVKAFQAKYGISQVGEVGPLTRARLNAK